MPARLHRLAWDIDEETVELVVDPRLTEVAGPRLRVEPVDGPASLLAAGATVVLNGLDPHTLEAGRAALVEQTGAQRSSTGWRGMCADFGPSGIQVNGWAPVTSRPS